MPQRYSVKHSGVCLVVGYAPDVRSDVERARALRPDAVMLGVKYAACLYPEIEHVWTQHLEQAVNIKERAPRPVSVHARPKGMQKKWSIYVFGKTDDGVDYIWPELDWVCGSSGFAAALWARHGMGFDEVIMCGLPMQDRDYIADVASFKPMLPEENFRPAIKHWHNSIAVIKARGQTAGITSMSGFTREALGAPA